MNRLKKLWQRCVLDTQIVVNPPPLALVFAAVFGFVFAAGFWCAHWIDQVDLSSYKPYDVMSDNIGEEPIFYTKTMMLPVDVVYTWVNGSDPFVIDGLLKLTNAEKFSCGYTNCFPSKYYVVQNTSDVANKGNMQGFTILKSLQLKEKNASRLFHIIMSKENEEVLKEQIKLHLGDSIFIQQAYWTTEKKVGWSIEWKSTFVVTLGPQMEIHEEISNISPDNYKYFNEHCETAKHKDLYIIDCPDVNFAQMLKNEVIGFKKRHNVSFPKEKEVYLVLHFDSAQANLDTNRFEDNEELRYSLRSLEKFAPWVRKIFLVTNGQIPYWLNLDHPRMTIITHEQIFADLSHLPTYSSPAIEANIHRIPGLSEHFLYLNDDVMFGDFVYLEDFYSITAGYKIYLAWSLPECSSGCPGTWISDGYCDHSCNSSACNWDGGDCIGAKDVNTGFFSSEEDESFGLDAEFCSSTCADSWLADLYCDTACSIPLCGFDAGDCGSDAIKENLHQLGIEIRDNITLYLPKGVVAGWIDLSALLKQYQNVTVKGDILNDRNVRVATVNVPYAMMIFVLKGNCSGFLQIDLMLANNEDFAHSKKIHFIIHYDTFPENYENKKMLNADLTNFSKMLVRNFSFPNLFPKILNSSLIVKNMTLMSLNLSDASFPSNLTNQIRDLEEKYFEGKLTEKGFHLQKILIIEKYFETFYKGKKDDKGWQNRFNFKGDLKNASNLRKILAFDGKEINYYYPSKEQRLEDFTNHNLGTFETFLGHFPWERYVNTTHKSKNDHEYEAELEISRSRRRLLDTFADSLLYVNQLYNSEYGFEARRVPAHMPHFISKGILKEVHQKFSQEFYLTSSHKLRQRNDMQFSFSYFYYLMSEKRNKTYEEIFDQFDTDFSGTWSDREIRTFLTKTNDLPLHYNSILDLHRDLKNCSQIITTKHVPTQPFERYADSDLPTISKELIVKCSKSILEPRMEGLKTIPRFLYSSVSDSAIHFKMINSNISSVVYLLDEVRKNSRKFICLNSNLDPKGSDNDLIRALVQDTYESLYPSPSSFELPSNYRNRFLYTWELNKWKRWRNATRAFIYASMCCLIMLTLITFFSKEIETMKKKWCRRSKRKEKFLVARV